MADHSKIWLVVMNAGALVLAALVGPASAASLDQIKEACKQALCAHGPGVGVSHGPGVIPGVQARGPGAMSGPGATSGAASCYAAVYACVVREQAKQAIGTPAPAAPKDDSAATLSGGTTVQPTFVAPPRTIADITAILDSEKPDEAKIAARKAAADAPPPTGGSTTKLADFYRERAEVRALLARNTDALADALKAFDIAGKGGVDPLLKHRIQQFVGLQYRAVGDPKNAAAIFDTIIRLGDEPGNRGTLINALGNMVQLQVAMGDVSQAATYSGRMQQRIEEARGSVVPRWRIFYASNGNIWESQADLVRAAVFEARGQYPEAETAYRRSEAFRRAAVKDIPKMQFPPTPEQVLQAADSALQGVARNEARQGKLSAAEADARRALLEILKTQGKYNPATPSFIVGLAGILVEQGRYQEAERLARSALDVQRTLGIADEAPESVNILSGLGNILVAQRRLKDASEIYAELDKAIAQWPPQRREAFELNGSRIAALYSAGQVEEGIKAANALVNRQTARTGAGSFDAASAHGTLAVGYALAGRDADAIREFKAALPILIGTTGESDDDDSTLVAARSARLQRIVEAYIGVLARNQHMLTDVAVETFRLADAVRGHSVQKALAASSARMVAKDAALAELARTDQDHARQISAQLGALNNLLALPSDQRDDQTVRAINAAIAKLRDERKAAQQQIKQRFPAYANLIDPKPPTVDDIKASLRSGEALISFYFGQDKSFVWAVPKDGDVAFAEVATTAIELEANVRRLRTALEPQVTMVSEIPPFDVGLAYQLYAQLLKPVEPGWQNSKRLIVVTNGALGELPLALLPTASTQIDPQAQPLFAGYRNVPWLAREHAVTVIPSASALVTLRNLPPGAPSREKLIGFGDPYFNAQEAAEAEAEQNVQVAAADTSDAGAATTRGIPLRLRAAPHTEDVDKAELALLPRLPDTRLELIAMAKALDTDPATALYLGKAANEQNVGSLNLSRYKIVAFATHGLVPGDVDGLTQPALALTAPDIAGTKGDGLLTMEKILALKLDADWVVLSACNTAAGAGAGAEAASGLGSAFFYAGTRALLVTNWSVHSASARALIADLFRRQSADPMISRSEALRQSMMALIDGPGSADGTGRTIFTYAHPLFWAPYSLIGDGG